MRGAAVVHHEETQDKPHSSDLRRIKPRLFMWRRITGLVLLLERLVGEIADMSCYCADRSVADRLS